MKTWCARRGHFIPSFSLGLACYKRIWTMLESLCGLLINFYWAFKALILISKASNVANPATLEAEFQSCGFFVVVVFFSFFLFSFSSSRAMQTTNLTMKLVWAEGTMFSKTSHEYNSLLEKDWQSWRRVIVRTHCTIFLPMLACTS